MKPDPHFVLQGRLRSKVKQNLQTTKPKISRFFCAKRHQKILSACPYDGKLAERREKDKNREIENLTHILFYLKFSGQKVKVRTERGIQGRNLVILRGEGAVIHNRKDNIKHGLSPSRHFCDSVKRYDLSQSVKCR